MTENQYTNRRILGKCPVCNKSCGSSVTRYSDKFGSGFNYAIFCLKLIVLKKELIKIRDL